MDPSSSHNSPPSATRAAPAGDHPRRDDTTAKPLLEDYLRSTRLLTAQMTNSVKLVTPHLS